MNGAPGPLEAELLEVALDAAARAVDLIHTRRPADLGVRTKSSATDMVTEMDTASEALIREVIAARRPGDTVIGEEGGEEVGGDGGITWWVDPIDGTTNYVYDHPGYAISVAAEIGGRTVAGAVADPTHGRTYGAVAGGGAWCAPGGGSGEGRGGGASCG